MKRHFIKRPVIASVSNNTSQLFFDFIYGDEYSQEQIESVIYSVLEGTFNLDVLGIDFRSVNYEGIKEFAGQNISQCGVDFAWSGDYDGDAIVEALSEELDALRYELIGSDFNSL